MSVNFKNAIPSEMVIRQPVSTSKSVLRKNLMEVQPHDSSVHAPNANDIIRFNISSNSDFLIGKESYFRFRLRRTGRNNYDNKVDALSGYLEGGASLDVGGVHSLFKSIEVRSLSTGTLLQRYDHYNRYYALKSYTQQSADEVEWMGQPYGDSVSDRRMDTDASGRWFEASGTVAGATLTAATGALLVGTAGTGTAQSEFAVGDVVHVRTVAASSEYPYMGTVVSITDDDTVIVYPLPAADIAATEIDMIQVWSKRSVLSARQMAVQTYGEASSGLNATADKILEFRPFVSLLDQDLPLFLMRGGIEIMFELDQAYRAIKTGLDLEADAGSVDYQITEPRFMAMLATPHPDIVDQYVQQWKSDNGVVFNIPSVKSRRLQGTTSETNRNLQKHFGVRSARKVYTIVQDSNIAENDGALARSEQSIGFMPRTLINQFQYKVGSHEYPTRPVNLGAAAQAIYPTEALEQLKNVSGSANFRFSPREWSGVNLIKIANDVSVKDESRVFIMSADLSRDNGRNSNLTGADLSVVPLDIELERTGAYNSDRGAGAGAYTGTPVYYTFVEHDAFLKLSSQQLSVMN